jgi:hypothetical protein
MLGGKILATITFVHNPSSKSSSNATQMSSSFKSTTSSSVMGRGGPKPFS